MMNVEYMFYEIDLISGCVSAFICSIYFVIERSTCLTNIEFGTVVTFEFVYTFSVVWFCL